MTARIVIVGGGLAAATAAQELRKGGHTGPIDLVAGEPHLPYERPPLSKGYLLGNDPLSAVFVGPDDWHDALDVTVHTGAQATHAGDGYIQLDGGVRLPFDQLLLATGLTPRELDVPGADAPYVHTFRTIDDAERLRTLLEPGHSRVAVVGSGWIGLELAAAARAYGNTVTVISHSRVPLDAAIGDTMGRMFQQLHEQHGVTFLLERAVEAVEAHAVRTDRETVHADVVIVGIGATPNVALAHELGLDVDHGILVSERMETSVPGIFAAGDVANAFHPVLGERLRSEHWAFAIASATVAASSMLGGEKVLDDIPYFYTDQYDLGMEYSGYGPLSRDSELCVRGDLESREFIAFWVADSHVVAGMNVNVWDVNDEVQRLIRERVSVTREQLTDLAVELGSIS